MSPECTSLACEASSLLFDPAVITAATLFAAMLLVAFAHLDSARECCEEERTRVADERAAYAAFADRVAAFDAASPPERSGVGGVGNSQPFVTDGGPGLRRVLDAYRETVMAVPHYDEEYGERAIRNLGEELGYDAASAVASNDTLSPELRSVLVGRSRQAAARREVLAESIEEELDALDRLRPRLASVENERESLHGHLTGMRPKPSVGAAADVWRRLDGLEQRCEEIVADRQRHLRDPPMDGFDDAPSFYEYLYEPLRGTNHPVLSEVADLLGRLRSDRDSAETRILRAD